MCSRSSAFNRLSSRLLWIYLVRHACFLGGLHFWIICFLSQFVNFLTFKLYMARCMCLIFCCVLSQYCTYADLHMCTSSYVPRTTVWYYKYQWSVNIIWVVEGVCIEVGSCYYCCLYLLWTLFWYVSCKLIPAITWKDRLQYTLNAEQY